MLDELDIVLDLVEYVQGIVVDDDVGAAVPVGWVALLEEEYQQRVAVLPNRAAPHPLVEYWPEYAVECTSRCLLLQQIRADVTRLFPRLPKRFVGLTALVGHWSI